MLHIKHVSGADGVNAKDSEVASALPSFGIRRDADGFRECGPDFGFTTSRRRGIHVSESSYYAVAARGDAVRLLPLLLNGLSVSTRF
jgi:hypothetical protein